MQVKEKVLLHNKFEIEVVDAVTGELKQKAYAYNVIVNYYFSSRLTGSPLSVSTDLFRYIALGTGNGTPAITDTALFTHLTRKAVTTLETVYEYPTSHTTKQIKLEATECNGYNITEVGLEGYYSGTWSTYYYLMTHAMLQDSEGNQIAIAKTDVDVVYITATFYATYTPSGFGDGGIYPTAENNYLVRWLLTGSYDSTIRFGRFPLEYASELTTKYTSSKSYSIGTNGSMTTLQLDLPVTTFLDSECNNRIVKHLGIAGFGAFTFPNHDAFPPYPINHLVIGEGDGETTEFNIKCPLIQAGTPRVFVNDVELTEGTDFTVDCESNCGDWYENYHSAAFTAQDSNVEFGNIKSCTPYTGTSYTLYDPLAWWNCYNSDFYPTSCTISQSTPVWIDFLEPKSCNRLKIDINTVPAAQIGNLVIEYSTDNENWIAVEHTRSGQVWSWEPVTARYWRIYIPDYNWSFSMVRSNATIAARDGLSYRSSFFLGKTVPGLKLTNPPAAGETIEASYSIEYPFKTANNLLRFTCSIQLQRG